MTGLALYKYHLVPSISHNYMYADLSVLHHVGHDYSVGGTRLHIIVRLPTYPRNLPTPCATGAVPANIKSSDYSVSSVT